MGQRNQEQAAAAAAAAKREKLKVVQHSRKKNLLRWKKSEKTGFCDENLFFAPEEEKNDLKIEIEELE